VVPYLGVRLEPQKALETVNLELGLDWLRLNILQINALQTDDVTLIGCVKIAGFYQVFSRMPSSSWYFHNETQQW